MGEGSQVAGSAQRALLIDDGKNVLVEHVHEALHGDELCAGMSVGERLRFQEKHQFHNLRAHFFTGAAGMGHHQVVLQLAQVLLGNAYVVQRAESGGDTIDRPPDIVHFVVQVLAAFHNGLHGFLRQRQFFFMVDNFLYPFQGKMCERDGMHIIVKLF